MRNNNISNTRNNQNMIRTLTATFICAFCLSSGSFSFKEMTDIDISGVYMVRYGR